MSHPEQLPLPPLRPAIDLPRHDLAHPPLGQGAVSAHERSIFNDASADWNAQAADFGEAMNYKFADVPARTRIVARKILADGPGLAHDAEPSEDISAAADTASSHPIAQEHRESSEIQKKARDTMRAYQHERIDAARQRLSELTPEDRIRFKAYFENHAPQGLQTVWGQWQQKTKLKDKIDNDPANMLAHVPEATLLNFLQWHNTRMEEVNRDPATLERLAENREQFKESVTRLFRNLPFGQEAISNVHRIDRQPVVIGDVFDTKLRQTHGKLIHSQDMMVLEEDYDKETFDHESLHVLGYFADTDLNEAMAEHVALALENGYIYTVDPDKRLDVGTYYARRKLMAARLESGIGPSLVPQAVDAFFEDELDGPKREAFEVAEAAAFGGVHVGDLITHQKEAALARAESFSPKLPESYLQEYALTYAAEAVEMLGAAARGVGDEEIIAEKLAHFMRNDASDPNAHVAAERGRTEENRLREHLADIRRYLQENIR